MKHVSTLPYENESKVEANCGGLFCFRNSCWGIFGQLVIMQFSAKRNIMRLEVQIVVDTARAERIFGLIDGMTSLNLAIWQSDNDVVIDVYYTFGFMETELWEIEQALSEANYNYTYKEI